MSNWRDYELLLDSIFTIVIIPLRSHWSFETFIDFIYRLSVPMISF